MATDEGITMSIDFGEPSPKLRKMMMQRIYDNKDSHLGKALESIREDIAKKTQLPKELLFGSEDRNKMQRPFGYSWHRPIGMEGDEMTEFVSLRLPPSPALRPSPLFYFANLDDIRNRIQINEDIVTMTKKYRYQRNGVTCMYVLDLNDPIRFKVHFDPAALNEEIVRQLAKKYDEAMIKEVFKMNMVEFNRMSEKLARFGGTLELKDDCCWTRMRAIIEIPVDHLSKLAFTDDLLAKKFNAPPTIPEIKDIQVQNQKVVVVYFVDGTFTKSICGKDEPFNLYTGVMVCLFKRMLGESKDEQVYGQKKFTRLMAKAMGFFDKKYKARKKALEEKNARIAAQKAREEKNRRKKAKKREEQISIFAEALKRDREAAAWENRPETSSEDV